MLKVFGKKPKDNSTNGETIVIELKEPVDCLCDFTYNFIWQHKGEKLSPDWKIPNSEYTFHDVVEHLKTGGDVNIIGDVGHRLCSSMGVDLKYFGGSGEEVNVGNVIVDGSVDTRMGISMVKGSLYVKGEIKEPIGNLIQVESDKNGYKKFKSITDIISNGLNGEKLIKCQLLNNMLLINDGTVKDTVGARLDKEADIVLNGNVDLSTGILMRRGRVRINGNAGRNTGALLNGGLVIINGNTDDFTGIDMISGTLIINGNAGKFLGANKKSGIIFAHKGSPIPPTQKSKLDINDSELIRKQGFNPGIFTKYK
ncbi:MAG: hypothetical protein ACP5C3_04280 [Methanomicrobiales archaeon]